MDSYQCSNDFNCNKMDVNDSLGLIDIYSDEFNYFDSIDSWLQCSDNNNSNNNNINNNNNNNNVKEWIKNAFTKEKSKGSNLTLINKLDELKLLSPHSPIDTRTFTRHKRNNQRRETLFNATTLATLYSPLDENEFNPDITSPPPPPRDTTITYESHNRTFEVQTGKKSMNGTFTLNTADTTFTVCNDDHDDHDHDDQVNKIDDNIDEIQMNGIDDMQMNSIDDIQMNNIDDVEKIAKIQEENLKQSCSNGSSPRQRSPIRNHLTNFNNRDKRLSYHPNSNCNNINSNTLTKTSRDSLLRHSTIADALVDDLNSYPIANEDSDHYYYQNCYSPEENMFQPSHLAHNTSTPLVPRTHRTVNYPQQTARDSIVPKIMPNVSNLKAHSSYGQSKIGRSEPNLSKRLQPLNKPLPNNSTRTIQYGVKSSDNGSDLGSNRNNTTLIESKMPSDSRLMVRNGFIRQPHNQTQTLTRITSQTQQQLVGKVSVEGESNRIGTTNLSRKSTFRVRDYPINSQDTDFCLTNTHIANGYQTNKPINHNSVQSHTVQRNVSKIPGPKSIRSGIPVSGTRTAMAGAANNRLANHTDNSWRNGCF